MIYFVPAGTPHNVINTGEDSFQLFTIHTESQHVPGTVHRTKVEADAAEDVATQ